MSYVNSATVQMSFLIWIIFEITVKIIPGKFRYSEEKHYLCRKIKATSTGSAALTVAAITFPQS